MNNLQPLEFKLSETRLAVRRENDREIDELTEACYQKWLEKIRQSNGDWVEIRIPEVGTFHKKESQARLHVLYRLKNNPNIVSTNLGRSKAGRRLSLDLQPLAFRWVDEAEKKDLNFRAVAAKNVPEEYLERLRMKMQDSELLPEDILCIVSALIHDGADKRWTNIDPMTIAVRFMQPIDITVQVIQELVSAGVLFVCSYWMDSEKKTRKRKMRRLACALAFDDDRARELNMLDGEAIAKEAMAHAEEMETSKHTRTKKVTSAELDKRLTEMQGNRPKKADEKKADKKLEADRKQENISHEQKVVALRTQKNSVGEKSLKPSDNSHRKTIDKQSDSDIMKSALERVFQDVCEQLEAKDREIEKLQEELEKTSVKLQQMNSVSGAANSTEGFVSVDSRAAFMKNMKGRLAIMTRHIIKNVEAYAAHTGAGSEDELALANLANDIHDIVRQTTNQISDFKD